MCSVICPPFSLSRLSPTSPASSHPKGLAVHGVIDHALMAFMEAEPRLKSSAYHYDNQARISTSITDEKQFKERSLRLLVHTQFYKAIKSLEQILQEQVLTKTSSRALESALNG